MLIAPLMRPLVHASMGLATGSAGLTLGAMVRTIASIVLVVVVAFGLTWLLPFHEITNELEARTTPSLLDLAIAAACALAAAYATLRADAEIATTAAGTSIGISLVPPLCACGYALALRDFAAARGAALLFTANLTGILAVTTLMFVLAGFADTRLADPAAGSDSSHRNRAAVRVGFAWSRLAGRQLGPFARFVPPLLLLALVYVPLQNAVGEIKRTSEIRSEVSKLLDDGSVTVVQYHLRQSTRGVSLRVIVVGDAATTKALSNRLREHLVTLGVGSPDIAVWAVPEAAAVSALAQRLDDLPPPPQPEPRSVVGRGYSADVAREVRAAWPSQSGALVDVSLDVAHPDHLRVIHLGQPLGPAALHLLSRAIEPAVDHFEIDEEAFEPVEASADAGIQWLPAALGLLDRIEHVPGLHACFTMPASPPPPARPAKSRPIEVDPITPVRNAIIARVPSDSIVDGDRWRIAPSLAGCSVPAAAPPGDGSAGITADAGVDAGGDDAAP
jgi:uncharacterized hydrophobic protein (TIGR00271 family)